MLDSMTVSLLIFGAVLFTAGFVGFLTRRSLILLFLSLELMLAGASMNFITFSRHHSNYQGQVFVIMILTVAACEASIALALVTMLYRRKATLDVKAWSELSETLEQEVPETPQVDETPKLEFPSLTPAGLDPMQSPMPSEFKAELSSVAPPHETPAVTKIAKEASHV
jgi:NADH-quinone oxidoreductase subunit K